MRRVRPVSPPYRGSRFDRCAAAWSTDKVDQWWWRRLRLGFVARFAAAMILTPIGATAQTQQVEPTEVASESAEAASRSRAILGEQRPLERLRGSGTSLRTREARYLGGAMLPGGSRGGRQIGNLVVGGAAASTVTYDSNVDAEPNGGDGDAVLATAVGLEVSPLLRRHTLALRGSVTATGVLPDVGESDPGWELGAAGTLNISARSTLDTTLIYSRQVEDPESPDRVTEADPERSDRIRGSAGYSRRYKRSRASFGVGVESATFEESSEDDYIAPSISAGFAYAVTPRLGIEITPGVTQTTYREQESGEPDRDSRTLSTSLAANYQPGRNTAGRLSIGFQYTDFADSSRDAASGVIFDAGLNRRLDTWTSVDFRATRTFDPTTNATDTGGATVSELGVRLQRVLGQRLIADVDLGTSLVEYEGIDRTDTLLRVGGGLAFMLTDTVNLVFRYGYSEAWSDDTDAEFQRHTITAGIAMRF